MSLLDELKKQAAQKDQRNVVDETRALQQTERNWHRLSPKMYVIHGFLKEFAENLNIVKPREPCEFGLTRTLSLKGLIKENFRVVKVDSDSLKSFDLLYDLVGPRDVQVVPGGAAESERFRAVLKEHSIPFSDKIESPTRIVFMIQPKISTRFNYTADLDSCGVLLRIDRFAGTWSQRLRYEPEAVTDTLMEETGKYILGRPNRFMELSGNLLSDETREMLRARISSDKAQKEKLLQAQETLSPLETTANRLRGLFRKP
jgi:hypothetical protein